MSFRTTSPMRRRGSGSGGTGSGSASSAVGALRLGLHHPGLQQAQRALPHQTEDIGRGGGVPIASIAAPLRPPTHSTQQQVTVSPKRAGSLASAKTLFPLPSAHAQPPQDAAINVATESPHLIHSFAADTKCFCPVDPTTVWTADRSGAIKARDVLSGEVTSEVFRRPGTIAAAMIRVGFFLKNESHDGPTVWVGFNDGIIRVFSIASGALIREIGKHNGGVFALCEAFGTVFSSGADWKVTQWCPVGYRQVHQLTSPSSSSVKYMVSGEAGCAVLVTGGHDGVIRVYSRPDPQSCFDLIGHTAAIVGLVLVNGMLWSASDDRTIRLWDLQAKKALRVINAHPPYKITSDIISMHQVNMAQLQIFLKDGSVMTVSRDTCAITNEWKEPCEGRLTEKANMRHTAGNVVGHFSGDVVWNAASDGRVKVMGFQLATHPFAEMSSAKALADERLAEVATLQGQVQALQQTVQETSSQMEAKEREFFQATESSAEAQAEAYRRRQQQHDQMQTDATDTIHDLKAKNENLLSKIHTITDSHERLLSEVVALKERSAADHESYLQDKQEHLASCEKKCLLRYETQVTSLTNQLTAVATENETLRQQTVHRDERHIQLEENLRDAISDTSELASLRIANKEAVAAIGSLEVQVSSLSEALTLSQEKNAQLSDDLTQARTDRDMLSTEVRRLGELLSEVSQKAKQYQTAYNTELERIKQDLSCEKHDVEQKLAEEQSRTSEVMSEVDSLKKANDERDAVIADLKAKLREQPDLLDQLKRQYEQEMAKLRDELSQLRESERRREEADLASTNSRSKKIKKALGDTQKTLSDLGKLSTNEGATEDEDLMERIKRLEESLLEKEEALKKAEAELEQLKGDSATMGLYTQLQHEQVVKRELQRNNENLCETIEQLKERILVLSSANRTLQGENDRLLSDTASQADVHTAGGVNFAPMPGSNPPTSRHPTNNPSSHRAISELEPDILHSKVIPSELGGTSGIASGILHASASGQRAVPAEKMNNELDSIVSYLDNMKHKLDSLETAAEEAADPYLREALLQEINTLHRQVLDDTLCHKASGAAVGTGGASSIAGHLADKRNMDLPSPVAGGILKMASEKFSEVEKIFGLDDHDVKDKRSDKRASDIDGYANGIAAVSSDVMSPRSAATASSPANFPSFNPNSMAGLVRSAYGFSSDVNTHDVHPSS